MVIWLSTFALAGAIDALDPLPACEEAGLQQVLLDRVGSLVVPPEEEGIWVMGWSDLTRRDAHTLEVLERPLPGVHGWNSHDRSSQRLGLVSTLGTGFEPHARPLWSDISRFQFGQKSSTLLQNLGPTRSPLTPDVRWLEHPSTLELARLTRGASATSRVATNKSLPDGSVIVASTTALVSYDSEGNEQARVPVVPGTDAVGIVRERLFTVSDGELSIWGPSDRHVVPGTWSSAAALGNNLLAADLAGQLWLVNLSKDRLRSRACAVDDCGVEPLPWPAPPEVGHDAIPLRTWSRDLQVLLRDHPPAPVELLVTPDAVVVAHLHPQHWQYAGVHAIVGLSLLNASGSKVRAHITLDEPLMGPLEHIAPGSVGMRGRAWSTEDLSEHAAERSGKGLAVEPIRGSDGQRVELVEWREGQSHPLEVLPPRLRPEYRYATHGHVVGERLVVSSFRRGFSHKADGGTEVWCLAASNSPGQTAILADFPDEHGSHRTPWPNRARASRYGGPTPGSAGAPEPLAPADQALLYFAQNNSQLPASLVELAEQVPVVVHANVDPAASPPEGVTWHRSGERRSAELLLTRRGVQVWSGSLSAFSPHLLEVGPAPTGEPAEPYEAPHQHESRELEEARSNAKRAGNHALYAELTRTMLEGKPRSFIRDGHLGMVGHTLDLQHQGAAPEGRWLLQYGGADGANAWRKARELGEPVWLLATQAPTANVPWVAAEEPPAWLHKHSVLLVMEGNTIVAAFSGGAEPQEVLSALGRPVPSTPEASPE